MEKNAIIAVGNPGAGKSTTLNYLAGEVLFKSGDSFGGGLTSELNVGVSRDSNWIFYDTPGLADLGLRKAAGKAISKALREGGTYRIFFFISQDAGRPKNEDITTLNLVLEAAPEIGSNYSIIVPKIKPRIADGLRKDANWAKFLNGIFAGIDVCNNNTIYAFNVSVKWASYSTLQESQVDKNVTSEMYMDYCTWMSWKEKMTQWLLRISLSPSVENLSKALSGLCQLSHLQETR